MLAMPLLYHQQTQYEGEWKGEDGGRGLKTSVASYILVPSVRQSNWYVLGLPWTLGAIKQPLAELQLPLYLPVPPDTCPKLAGRGGNGRAVLQHADTMEMPHGLWGWWLYTPALEASWFPGAVILMPPWLPCQDSCFSASGRKTCSGKKCPHA